MGSETTTSAVRIGTAGWSYRHWRGDFYPESVPQREWLAYYAAQLDTVEVNSTFYHLPLASTCRSWHERAPDGFLYALKASRYITHEKRLVDAAQEADLFVSRARLLGSHLGPLLFQLPPSLERNVDALRAFLDFLPDDLLCAFEFRNQSWYCDGVRELLDERGACFCSHDMPRAPSPRWATGPAVYVRFHGPLRRYSGAYPDDLLRDWADWLADRLAEGRNVYAYFNNDLGGHAPRDAHRLHMMLAA